MKAFANRRSVCVRNFKVLLSFAALLFGLLVCGVAVACKTPVYRFAMYNWERAPYRVYYLHDGPIAGDDNAILKQISDQADGEAASTNVELTVIDLAKAEPLAAISPERLGEARFVVESQSKETKPRLAIVSPRATLIYAGSLTNDAPAALADSPARKKAAEMLAQGYATVILLVEGDKADETEAAEAVCREVIEAGAAGKIVADPLANEAPNDDAPGDGVNKGPDEKKLKIGLIRVKRDDARERWLVAQLMHVEDDLAERTEPMAFLIYGRGRAHLPCIGKGVNVDMMTRQVRFVLGPCSCMVKDQNPGMDLITQCDWKATALAMAERHGPETGNEHLLGEAEFPAIFPELEPPPSQPESEPKPSIEVEPSSASSVETPSAAVRPADADKPVDADVSASNAEVRSPESMETNESSSDQRLDRPSDSVDQPTPTSNPNDAKESIADDSSEPSTVHVADESVDVTLIGIGVGVVGVLILLAAATVFMFQPRG